MLEDMHLHRMPGRIVQAERNRRALNDSRKLLGKIAKQFGQVVMSGDGFGNFQQGVVLQCERLVGEG